MLFFSELESVVFRCPVFDGAVLRSPVFDGIVFLMPGKRCFGPFYVMNCPEIPDSWL